MATVRVGVAQLAVARFPDKLETQALGSCVGVALYDPRAKIGGLSHAMLPELESAGKKSRFNQAKFVDTAIAILIDGMVDVGAARRSIQAKIAGGANMFPGITEGKAAMLIGERNVAMARRVLSEIGIDIVAEDVGGSLGRTVILDTATGILTVKSLRFGVKEL